MKVLIVVLISWLSLIACSQQWREGELGLTSEDLIVELESFSDGIQLQSTGAGSSFTSIYQNPNTNIYYSYGPSNFGPASLILSVRNFRIFDTTLDGYSFNDLSSAKVALLDQLDNGQRRFMLAFRFELSDGKSYVQYWNSESHSASGGSIQITFRTSKGEQITAVSNDLKQDSDDFTRLIRLELLNGLGQQVGVLPILQGYGS